ncbi:glycoside hydrolase family 3 C-terminal domain-containing protein [Microbacterium sp. NPDC089320]|uniref:beta-glucosidase family protein n=1 Tax=Microbacterium sp. NPDC089320 TaxID=3155182 RepID=UPI0034462C63
MTTTPATTTTRDEQADAAPTGAFAAALARVAQGAHAQDEARQLWEGLTDHERLWLLDGDTEFWPGMRSLATGGYHGDTPYVMGAVPRLGIPGVRFADGPRGLVVDGSTCFPVAMARGATWDVELEERIGTAIGEEVREIGANFFGGVCINLPRHPAWGRIQETYSDQPVILGAMGAAAAAGVERNAMACMKHYALNSMENARFTVDVTVDEATLHEVYLPHFRTVAEAGISAVMSSYNSANGEWCGQNVELLDTALRQDWGFDGVVMTDFVWGLRDAAASVRAGLDIEAPYRQQRANALEDALEDGEITEDQVRRIGERILRTQLAHYARRAADGTEGTRGGDAHIALAREAATRAAVLLKNETRDAAPALPLDRGAVSSVAVVGRLADLVNTGDRGSSDVHSRYVVTPLAGIRAALPDARVVTAPADADPQTAADAARGADAAVVVVGFTAEDEGEFIDGSLASSEALLALYPEPRSEAEAADRDVVIEAFSRGKSIVGTRAKGGDRRDLHLRAEDVATIRAVAAVNPRTIVIVVGAGAVLMEEWIDEPAAVLLGWYSGMEGGNALADLLVGAASPSGRLPFPIPASADHLPPLDIDATSITYDRWYGQRLLQRDGVTALFPLGWGLSYTTVEPVELSVTADASAATGTATVVVENTGPTAVHHVVQVYGTRGDGERAGERELLGFAVAELAPGARATVEAPLDLHPLGRWDAERREVVVGSGPVTIEASSYWGDPRALTSEVAL